MADGVIPLEILFGNPERVLPRTSRWPAWATSSALPP
jgi:hypothetical protein